VFPMQICLSTKSSYKGTCQFAKTFTPIKQQLYVQIIHAENKHTPLGSQLRQLP